MVNKVRPLRPAFMVRLREVREEFGPIRPMPAETPSGSVHFPSLFSILHRLSDL